MQLNYAVNSLNRIKFLVFYKCTKKQYCLIRGADSCLLIVFIMQRDTLYQHVQLEYKK